MKKNILTWSLVLLALSSLSLTASPQHENKPVSSPSDLSFSVCDHQHEQELLSSQKENITNQISQHKIKFLGFGLFQSHVLNYFEFRLFHQTLSARTFLLGRATALRAPPVTSLS
jgi:hypothetical protein